MRVFSLAYPINEDWDLARARISVLPRGRGGSKTFVGVFSLSLLLRLTMKTAAATTMMTGPKWIALRSLTLRDGDSQRGETEMGETRHALSQTCMLTSSSTLSRAGKTCISSERGNISSWKNYLKLRGVARGLALSLLLLLYSLAQNSAKSGSSEAGLFKNSSSFTSSSPSSLSIWRGEEWPPRPIPCSAARF